jgi:hypothetical protein
MGRESVFPGLASIVLRNSTQVDTQAKVERAGWEEEDKKIKEFN